MNDDRECKAHCDFQLDIKKYKLPKQARKFDFVVTVVSLDLENDRHVG